MTDHPSPPPSGHARAEPPNTAGNPPARPDEADQPELIGLAETVVPGLPPAASSV